MGGEMTVCLCFLLGWSAQVKSWGGGGGGGGRNERRKANKVQRSSRSLNIFAPRSPIWKKKLINSCGHKICNFFFFLFVLKFVQGMWRRSSGCLRLNWYNYSMFVLYFSLWEPACTNLPWPTSLIAAVVQNCSASS